METNTTVENLRAEHARLDAIIREEESHICLLYTSPSPRD